MTVRRLPLALAAVLACVAWGKGDRAFCEAHKTRFFHKPNAALPA